MTTNKTRRIIAAVLCLACVVLLVLGAVNLPKKNNASGDAILGDLRVRTLLNATGDGVVEIGEMLRNLRQIGYNGPVSVEVMDPALQALPAPEFLELSKKRMQPLLGAV